MQSHKQQREPGSRKAQGGGVLCCKQRGRIATCCRKQVTRSNTVSTQGCPEKSKAGRIAFQLGQAGREVAREVSGFRNEYRGQQGAMRAKLTNTRSAFPRDWLRSWERKHNQLPSEYNKEQRKRGGNRESASVCIGIRRQAVSKNEKAPECFNQSARLNVVHRPDHRAALVGAEAGGKL